MICIVTQSNDLHALAVQRTIAKRNVAECSIIECDTIAQRKALSLRLSREVRSGLCITSEGRWIDVASERVLWLRRPRAPQVVHYPLQSETATTIVENDCCGALKGLLVVAFKGKWISTYEALIRGSDKVGQLQAAAEAGWRVPETMVTQSRSDVIELFNKHSTFGIIVKAVVGAEGPLLLTRTIRDPMDFEDASYEAAPAIYQECIPGKRHIRLVCFGNHSLAASIDSEELDWRPNLNVPIKGWPVPHPVHELAQRTLRRLDLEMGVIDLKETPQGELVWLEVNPQGQFLFLEPLTNLKLAEHFADYLLQSAESA